MDKYCRECGKELVSREVEASKVSAFRYDSGGGSYNRLGPPFNSVTGAKNLAEVVQCPDFMQKWFGDNDHDRFCIYNGDTNWCITVSE